MALVLVIDDDASMRRMIRRCLEGAGHAVLEAQHGRIGTRIAEEHRPSVVITDILMPETEGIETIRSLRSGAPEVKILAISGGADDAGISYLRMAGVLGANDVLAKPFRKKELMSAVERLLGCDQAPNPRGDHAMNAQIHGRGMKRILLIDDNEAFRRMCRQVLDETGHTVECAADGVEGLALFRRLPCDVVITDVMMPAMDGIDLIKALRSGDRRPKIVAMSGGSDRLASDDALRVCQALGVDAVLYKPFRPSELRAVIDGL